MENFQTIVSHAAIVVRSGYETCRKVFSGSNDQVPIFGDPVDRILPLPATGGNLAAIVPPSPESAAKSSETSFKEEIDFDISGCEDFSFRIPESIDSKRPFHEVNSCPEDYPNKLIVDVSWETCNPTSATVYSAVKEKAGYYARFDHHVIVGPYNPDSAEQFTELNLPSNNPLDNTLAIMRQAGFRMVVGNWHVPGSPLTILFDIVGAQGVLDKCRNMIERRYPVKISPNDNLASGAIIFGHVVEVFMSTLNEVLQKHAATHNTVSVPIIAHFHEWTSALGIMFMRLNSRTKGVAVGYTEHESPSMSFTRTGCSTGWMTHRDLFNNCAKYEADKNIQYGDQLDFVYDEAITICYNKQITLYFDMVWNFDYETQMDIQNRVRKNNFTDRYVVLAPCFDESNVRGVIDEVVIPGGSPLAVAVQTLQQREGLRVTVGRLKIPGQPLIVLIHLLNYRDNILRRSKYKFCPLSYPDDKQIYSHMVTEFYGSFSTEKSRQEIRTGQKVPMSIRIFE